MAAAAFTEIVGSNGRDRYTTSSDDLIFGVDGDDIYRLGFNSAGWLVGGRGADEYTLTSFGLMIVQDEGRSAGDLLNLTRFRPGSPDSFGAVIDGRHLFLLTIDPALDTDIQAALVIDYRTADSRIETYRLGGETYTLAELETALRQSPNFVANASLDNVNISPAIRADFNAVVDEVAARQRELQAEADLQPLVDDDDGHVLRGDGDVDRIFGNGGDDIILGFDGDDDLEGGPGDDRLVGGPGDDRMAGGPGDDIYDVHDAGDVVIESAGEGDRDRANIYADYVSAGEVEFITGQFAAMGLRIEGSAGRESIVGANKIHSGDTILGNDGNDRVAALVGDDEIFGGEGNDRLVGNSGDDVIVGGPGNDRVTGQFASDRFVHAPGDGTDRVTDFRPGEDDLDLTAHNLDSPTAALALAEDTAGGVFFQLPNDEGVLLQGVARADLSENDVLA